MTTFTSDGQAQCAVFAVPQDPRDSALESHRALRTGSAILSCLVVECMINTCLFKMGEREAREG